MALIFQVDDEGHVGPNVRCDKCGGIIKNYADGAVQFETPDPKPGTIIEPIFHCGGCELAEKKSHPARQSMPLDHFMLYVLNNIQLTPNALAGAEQKWKFTSS
jgi:hypothetical protein